ncbi:hypothetical protein GCM10007907_02720 [Chitinimonas prasina]|uniref:Uncharacterized protein n=1 Tax=Chitinimonas prasina TaxID=1434937 RepID=A0ABQ5YAQ3_9NEIS|nr:hypothetical protein GCM10007907_02720 [Chitinimonas prasina]
MQPHGMLAEKIDYLERAIFFGNLDLLKGKKCPICRQGKLLYSVTKNLINTEAKPGRRYKGSVNIYCTGLCNTMITHANAFIPAWAETISNWDELSDSLA